LDLTVYCNDDLISLMLKGLRAQLTASRTWVIPNTSGRGDVYIRFKSQSSDYALLTAALTGNNNLTFTAQKSGTDGNSVSVKYTNAGGTQALLITINGNEIDILLRTTSGTINSTSAEIQSALYGDPGVSQDKPGWCYVGWLP
jgi:hypothetical protein